MPLPGLNPRARQRAYPNQLAFGAPPKKKLAYNNIPAKRYNQYPKALILGNAMLTRANHQRYHILTKTRFSGITARNTIVVPCMVNN